METPENETDSTTSVVQTAGKAVAIMAIVTVGVLALGAVRRKLASRKAAEVATETDS